MNTLDLKLYDTLRKDLNLNEEKSRAITKAIQEIVQREYADNKKEAATQDFVKKKNKELELKIEQTKSANSKLFKWVIGLFVALALLILGLYIKT